VLVTGAGGFIGSHLTERLAVLGATVRAFVHYNALGSWGWLDESPRKNDIEVVAGDICDYDSVLAAAEDVDFIFHLAALIGIPYSYEAPRSYVRTNVDGTLNVLNAARARGVGRVVQTSTSEVYGTAAYVPIDEAHPLHAQSPYAATKIGADKLAESYFLSFKLPVVIVRPFNTYGPRQSKRAIIPSLVSQCLAEGEIRVGNLTPTRDLNFVSDTVEGFVAAASSDGAVGRVVNLGTGVEVSIGELAALIVELMGTSARLVVDPARVRPAGSEVERLLAANALAKELTGWTPSVPLREGLQTTIEWIRAHTSAYRENVYQR
jgi:dTDP-glucose 4,6-dehydratase